MSQSTGPKTPEGKAISSRNALRHGLTSAQIIVPGEDPAEYDALHATLTDSHQPAAGLESILVDQIAQCVWRLNRARRIERDALEEDLAGSGSLYNSRLDRIARYMTSIERELHRTIRELTAIQTARVRNTAVADHAKSELQIALIQRELHNDISATLPDFPIDPAILEDYKTNPTRRHSGYPFPPAAPPPGVPKPGAR